METQVHRPSRQITLTVADRQESQIRSIADREKRPIDSILLDILDVSIQTYLASNSAPRKEGHCQMCGHLYSKRKLHAIVIGFEIFLFCDGDFFSGAYKRIILQLLP
jgi:hypothetical protein